MFYICYHECAAETICAFPALPYAQEISSLPATLREALWAGLPATRQSSAFPKIIFVKILAPLHIFLARLEKYINVLLTHSLENSFEAGRTATQKSVPAGTDFCKIYAP
ncbi:MAG: hypothetical protein Q8M83_00825 [bacterium]|nr:hypothetical protein [bacterium]